MKWPTEFIKTYIKTVKRGIVANSSSKIDQNLYKNYQKSCIVAISRATKLMKAHIKLLRKLYCGRF